MRIIGGTAKGRRLLTAKGLSLRPTQDRVKESLFNMIGDAVIGAEFLDLFAGVGSIGLEALSRGARHVVFVEKNTHHIKILRKNLYNCEFSHAADIYCGDVLKVLKELGHPKKRKGEDGPEIGRFNFIFADPPYEKPELVLNTIKIVDSLDLLFKNGKVIIEHSKRYIMPQVLSTLALFRQKHFGDTALSFYRHLHQ